MPDLFNKAIMKYFRKQLIAIICFLPCLLVLTCHTSFAMQNNYDASVKQSITQAILFYIKNNTAVPASKMKVNNIIQYQNYARANVIPIVPIADPAIVFLKYTNHHWQVLSMGSAFDALFYQHYLIPKALRLN